MHVICPHCQSPIELAALDPPGEIVCSACGSSFRLASGSTTGWLPKEGRRLGRFELLERVGSGAFGTVYKARDPELDRSVAIKIPRSDHLAEGQELDRFLREARSVAQLRHPSIVPVYEVGAADGSPYLVSEFVQGMTLADRLTDRPPPFRESAELVAVMADALQYAHEMGVIHRDVKPSNVLLDEKGRPYLMDFGLAKRDAGEVTMTVEGQVLGTPAYMSPEQARGESHRVDGRSDVYSLGVILYQLLTAELPFRGNARMLLHHVLHDDPRAPHSLNDRVPRDLETICMKAMAKEPGKRYATARELADDLRRHLKGEPILARPVGALERSVSWVKRRPALAGLLAASIVATLSLVGVAVALVFNASLQRSFQETDQARQIADQAREVAETQSQRADTALRETERLRYFLHIARAHSEYRDGNMGLVEPLLDDCPAQHRNWEWHYLKRLCHLDVLTFKGYGPQDYSLNVAFHPDGKWLAASGPKGTVQLWDVNTGQAARTLMGHMAGVISVAFSPDGTRLASASMDQTVRIWDIMSGNQIHLLKAHVWEAGLGAVAFSSDGQRVALAGGDLFVQTWNAQTGREILRIGSPAGPDRSGDNSQTAAWVLSVAFSPSGTQLATGSADGLVKLWDAATGRLMRTLTGHTDWVFSVAFSPDGNRLVSADGITLKIWDVASGKVGLTLKTHDGAATFSPDGRWLATGSFDQTVRLWNATTGELITALRGHAGAVSGVAFSPDGTRLASVSDEYTVKLWETRASRQVRTLAKHAIGVVCVTFSPEGTRLASGSSDRTVKVWDVKTGQDTRTLKGHTSGVSCVAFSPNGTRLASGGEDRTVKIWDATTGQIIHTLRGHTDMVLSISFTPDGERLASASRDRTLKLWDTMTGQEVRTLRGHTDSVQGVTFSPDGKWLASGSHDRTLKLWNGTTGQEIRTFQSSASPVHCMALSRDGTHLASGYVDNTLKVWDVATGREVHTLTGHTFAADGVTFGPDGTRLASASIDSTIKLWDMASGQEILTLKGHTGPVSGEAFSPDGTWIASASEDHTLKLWDGRPWTARKLPE